MNIKLTEKEYQHMIMELIRLSIKSFDRLKNTGTEDMVDWIYFIERLKIKGMLGDISPLNANIKDKPKHVARVIWREFDNDNSDKSITTMI